MPMFLEAGRCVPPLHPGQRGGRNPFQDRDDLLGLRTGADVDGLRLTGSYL